MTLCNMSIECGARAGMIAPDATTFAWLKGRRFAPKGEAFKQACEGWAKLASDEDAVFDREVKIYAGHVDPDGHLGHHAGRCGAHLRQGSRSPPTTARPRLRPIWASSRART